jgi:4-hydroxythreonine-4-phosphate dehydrogenase
MRIGLTAGDPSGIGLEVILRSLPRYLERAEWVLFAHPADFVEAVRRYQPDLSWEDWRPPHVQPSQGLFLSPIRGEGAPVMPGEASAESGRRAMAALEAATSAAVAGRVDGIVTAPVAKRLMGPGFTGQTEFLKERASASQVAMAFFTPRFKVVVATTHVALREALAMLTRQHYVGLLRLIDRELRALGFPPSRIAVTGVNPHAGEAGLFGCEEQEILAPAIEAALAEGIQASGPWPADSCYAQALEGDFDVVLAPYHDQGLIPVKLIARGESANVTLGLPFIRTSPDHGTAFEIAGKGVARTEGMASAFAWVLDLTDRRRTQS